MGQVILQSFCIYLNTPRVGPLLKQDVLVDLGPFTNCQNMPSGPGSPQMEPVSTAEMGAVFGQNEVALERGTVLVMCSSLGLAELT